MKAVEVRTGKVHASSIDGTIKLVTVDINVEAFGLFVQTMVTTVVI